MTTVTVLAAVKISQRKVARRLERAGCTVTPYAQGLLISKPGEPDVAINLLALTELRTDSAGDTQELLGSPARSGVRCRFDGPVAESPAWPAVVGIARAVAAEVPLAVLDDHAGTVSLVHTQRGLIDPAEYEQMRGKPSTSDLLRRMLGG